jgi:hypothetical protein
MKKIQMEMTTLKRTCDELRSSSIIEQNEQKKRAPHGLPIQETIAKDNSTPQASSSTEFHKQQMNDTPNNHSMTHFNIISYVMSVCSCITPIAYSLHEICQKERYIPAVHELIYPSYFVSIVAGVSDSIEVSKHFSS